MTFTVPGLPAYQSSDAALAKWAQAVNNAIQAMGKAGLVTADDLSALATKYGLDVSSKRVAAPGDVSIDLGNGVTGSISITDLASKLVKNQQFKDALPKSTSTTTTTAQNDNAVNDLEARLTLIINDLAAQIASTSTGTATSTGSGISRGPVSASLAGVGGWSDSVAQQVLYTFLKTGRNWYLDTLLSTPSDPTTYLVVGDTVSLSYGHPTVVSYPGLPSVTQYDTTTTKQWMGASLGWCYYSYPPVAFQDVQNLQGFMLNTLKVIDVNLDLVGTTKVAGGWLMKGNGVGYANPTLVEIIQQFDYNTPGTQANNTLAQLANFQNRINALEQRRSTGSRDPITNGYGQLPFDALGNTYTATWHDSVASWCILYRLYGGQLPAFYDPMPTTWLIPGDRCRLTDNPGGGTTGGTFDQTRSWTGSAWV